MKNEINSTQTSQVGALIATGEILKDYLTCPHCKFENALVEMAVWDGGMCGGSIYLCEVCGQPTITDG